MTQSKSHSFIESLCQVFIGGFISWLVTIFLLPYWFPGYPIGLIMAAEITLLYLVIALCKSYIIRRSFNAHSRHGMGRARHIKRPGRTYPVNWGRVSTTINDPKYYDKDPGSVSGGD